MEKKNYTNEELKAMTAIRRYQIKHYKEISEQKKEYYRKNKERIAQKYLCKKNYNGNYLTSIRNLFNEKSEYIY